MLLFCQLAALPLQWTQPVSHLVYSRQLCIPQWWFSLDRNPKWFRFPWLISDVTVNYSWRVNKDGNFTLLCLLLPFSFLFTNSSKVMWFKSRQFLSFYKRRREERRGRRKETRQSNVYIILLIIPVLMTFTTKWNLLF